MRKAPFCPGGRGGISPCAGKGTVPEAGEEHLRYVIECMRNTSTRITNIKAYMITALYNAPMTMNHYYQQEVNYDMRSGGWQNAETERGKNQM